MKKVLALILGMFVGNGVSASNLKHEASMNFDLENVVLFLSDLNSKYELGLEVKKLGDFAASVPVEAERSVVVDISDSGRSSRMEFRVYMGDIDAPDLYMFFDSNELSELVSDFMMSWAEAKGM